MYGAPDRPLNLVEPPLCAAQHEQLEPLGDGGVPALRPLAALDQRPRTRQRAPLPNSDREGQVVGRFADAFHAGDVEGIVDLLTDDAWARMPPDPFEYQGHDAIASFLSSRFSLREHRRPRLVPTRANGQPAFGSYLPDAHAAIARPYGFIVLTLTGDRICAVSRFADCRVFPYLGLPRTLPVY